ncbi:hypothetical protein LNAOJCKE_0435 [Methylorubrum aminovorans]|uniref:Uncharacterized protein n=1 Tax=Methylorubrum aminovorans TaxID=269069 RepID=A0ABQ4U7L7_9HYPH|nr:hypothetical protein [Methylorubrum aminovorans]GJE63241.1 hypothetical protein LNAOJCKE_0435 [Methylorubrum aminovorans]GMA79291.1 hypothetical protein GCM10025880_57080 [Methylorubrum aminovorans]
MSFVVEIVAYPDEAEHPGSTPYSYTLMKIERDTQPEDRSDNWQQIPKEDTAEFRAWWRERHYTLPWHDRAGRFVVSDEIAVELDEAWGNCS